MSLAQRRPSSREAGFAARRPGGKQRRRSQHTNKMLTKAAHSEAMSCSQEGDLMQCPRGRDSSLDACRKAKQMLD